jgi:hypothetical protein
LSTAISSCVGSTSAGHKSSARFEPLTAGERQELVSQFRPALGGGAHIAEPVHHLAVDPRLLQAAIEKIDISENDGEKIVEIMGNA